MSRRGFFFRVKKCGPKGICTSKIDHQICLLRGCSQNLRVRKKIATTRVYYHNNAASPTTSRVHEFLMQYKLATISQSPRIKIALKRHRLDCNNAIQTGVTIALNNTPSDTSYALHRAKKVARQDV